MKIYQYKFVGTHLKHCDTKEEIDIFTTLHGVYFVFGEKRYLVKNIECLNYLCLSDGFYSLRELGEGELKKLEDKFGEWFR